MPGFIAPDDQVVKSGTGFIAPDDQVVSGSTSSSAQLFHLTADQKHQEPSPLSVVQNAPQTITTGTNPITAPDPGAATVTPSGGSVYSPKDIVLAGQPSFWDNVKDSMRGIYQKVTEKASEAELRKPTDDLNIEARLLSPISDIPANIKQGIKRIESGSLLVKDENGNLVRRNPAGSDNPLSDNSIHTDLSFLTGAGRVAFNLVPAAIAFNLGLNTTKEAISSTPGGDTVNNGLDHVMNLVSSVAHWSGYDPKENSTGSMMLEVGDFLLQAGMIAGLHKFKSMKDLKAKADEVANGKATPEQQQNLVNDLNSVGNVTPLQVVDAALTSKTPEGKVVAEKIVDSFANPKGSAVTPEEKSNTLYDIVTKHDINSPEYKEFSEALKTNIDPNNQSDTHAAEKLSHYENVWNQIKDSGFNDATNKEILETSWDAQQQMKLKKAIEADDNWKDDVMKASAHDDAVAKFNELKTKINDLKSGKREVLEGDHYKTVYEKPKEEKPNAVITPKDIVLNAPIEAEELPKLLPTNKTVTEIHHADSELDEKNKTEGINDDGIIPISSEEAAAKSKELSDNGVTEVQYSPMDRTVETKDAIEKAAPGKFKWIENNEIRSWDIGDETTGFHKMDREGFRKVENYFQDHPNETKLPDSFFDKGSEFEKYNGRSVKESYNQLAKRLINEHNRLASDPNSPNHIALLTHSKNIKLLDAVRDNGGEWNEQAKLATREDKVPGLEVRTHAPEKATDLVDSRGFPKNPIDSKLPEKEKFNQLKALTKENEPLVSNIVKKLNKIPEGVDASFSLKKDETILQKANRPIKKQVNPGYSVEHINDAIRFEAIVHDFGKMKDIMKVLDDNGVEIINRQEAVNQLYNPRPLGWVSLNLDARMPNGQIVEFQVRSLEADLIKEPHKGAPRMQDFKYMHDIYEKWRNRDIEKLKGSEALDYLDDVKESNTLAQKAEKWYAQRLGLDKLEKDKQTVQEAVLRGEKLHEPESEFIPQVAPLSKSALFTVATKYMSNELSERIKAYSDEYHNAVKSLMEDPSNKLLQKTFKHLQDGILRVAKTDIIENAEKLGVKTNFGTPYIGKWDGRYEPSFNLSFEAPSAEAEDAFIEYLKNVAEQTSQDAFIIEQESHLYDMKKNRVFSEYIEGNLHYPQIVVKFNNRLTIEEEIKLTKELTDAGIKTFSVDGDHFKASIIYEGDINDSVETKKADYDKRKRSISGVVARLEGRVSGVESSIQMSRYFSALNEGSEEPKRYAKNSNFRKEPPAESGAGTPPATGEPVITGKETPNPGTTGISHERQVERAKSIGAEPPVRGEGVSAKEAIEHGRDLLKSGVDPLKIAEDFKKDPEKAISYNNLSTVRAYHEELVRATDDASEQFGENSPEAKKAEKEESDWYNNTVKPMLTEWSKLGHTAQGEVEINTGTFAGIKRAFKQEQERDLTPKEEEQSKDIVSRDKKIIEEQQNKIKELEKAINAASKKKDNLTPKGIKEKSQKIADIIRQGKIHKPGQASAGSIISLAWDGALEVAAKTIEAGGTIAQAIADGVKHLRDHEAFKKASEEDKENTERELSIFMTHAKYGDLFTRFADKKDSKFFPDDVRDIWEYAKENYIDRGIEFNEAMIGVATDIGLKPSQVIDAIASSKAGKSVVNSIWKLQRERNKIQSEARRFIKTANESKFIRGLKMLPSIWFETKIFGHGTVTPITHAGSNLYTPSAWGAFFKNWGNSYKFFFGSAENYEKAMLDFHSDPMNIVAQRNGLAIDPHKRTEDYQTFKRYFGKISERSERAYNAVKIMRLDMFKLEYNRLSEAAKSDPDMMKSIAEMVNNATGAAQVTPPKILRGVLFAPRLAVAAWNTLLTQPFKAIETFTNWDKATEAQKARAKITARRTGELLATFSATLAINQGLLIATGSKQKINLTDPNESDWLKYKIGGKTITPPIPVLAALKFLFQLGYASVESRKEIHGKSRQEQMFSVLGQYGKGKLSPVAGTVFELATGSDYRGRLLPFRTAETTKQKKNQLTGLQYTFQQLPIPVAEGFEAVYETMKDKGMKEPDIEAILGGVLSSTVATTGFRTGNEPKPKKK